LGHDIEIAMKKSLLAFAIFLAGCDESPNNHSSIYSRLDVLEASKEEISTLQSEIKDLKLLVLAKESGNIAFLTTSSTKYQVVDTTVGKLFVTLEDTTKYANGYNLEIQVGNPNYVLLNDVKIKVTFGEDYGNINTVDETIPVLGAGRWTTKKIKIAPATEKDLNIINVKLEPSSITLLK
jgi:uncharacterized membrane protein